MINLHQGWALPSQSWIHAWWLLGWALVAACIVKRLTSRRLFGFVVFILLLIPGPYAPLGYWVLAFQSPSVTLVVVAWWMLKTPIQSREFMHENTRIPVALWLCLVTLGWLLLLDQFQLWPHAWISLFALGFEAAGFWIVLLLSLGLIGVTMRFTQDKPSKLVSWHWQLMVVLGIFAFLRLPTGNVWDALIDPFIWMFAHVMLVSRIFKRIFNVSSLS
jgi:hypothetical protein